MKRVGYLLIAFLLMVALIAGCSSTDSANPAESSEKENVIETEEIVESNGTNDFPITLTDALGNEVMIDAPPEKLITLVPSNTEIVYALGLLDNLIAVTDNDDFPEEVKEKDSIGGMEFNIEKIISLNPDLVIANAMNNLEGIEQIKNAGINILVVNNASSFDEVYDSIEMIGKATGTSEKAEKVIFEMKDRLSQLAQKAATITEEEKLTVWVEIWGEPLYTSGKGTFMDEMLTIIHATNAAGEQDGWPMFTEEDAVLLNPDVIITTYGHVPGFENAVEDVLARAAWQEVGAVKTERVYNVEANIVERPGPRLIEGVEKLAQLIYPDVFH